MTARFSSGDDKTGMIDWARSSLTLAGSTGPASRRLCLRARQPSAWRPSLAAKNAGLTVSCDLNYRSKLWKWGKKPSK